MLIRGSRVPFDQYQAIDATNISLLLELLISPKHLRWRKSNPRKDTAAYRLGRLVHSAVLEPMRLLAEYAVSPFTDMRTKKAQEWRDATTADGKTVITKAQFEAAEAMQQAVWAHRTAKKHVFEGEPEATFTWDDPKTGLPKKGRVDLLNGDIVDLKTTVHAHPAAFGRDAAKFHYHARLAWYQEGVMATTGEFRPVVLIAIEKNPPHDVAVYRISEEDLERGRRIYEPLMDQLAECLRSGDWPGVCEGEEMPLQMPIWATQEPDEDLLGLELELEETESATSSTEEAC